MASKMNNKRLDKTFQQKVQHVQKHNGIQVFWNKEGVWKRIKQALTEGAGGPKMIAWYVATAAGVSLLVASTVNFDQLNFNLFQDDSVVGKNVPIRITKSDENNEVVRLISLPADNPTLTIRSRQLSLFQSPPKIEVMEKLPEQRRTSIYTKLELAQKTPVLFKPNFRVKLRGGISANSRFVTHQIDFGVTMDVSRSEAIKKRLFIGTLIQFIRPFKGGEQPNENGLSTSYFVKSVYEKEHFEDDKRKGWSAGAEFLIHSEDDTFSNQVLKVFYSRNIMGKVKIGPEVMFTKGFKKVYPGIRLAVG